MQFIFSLLIAALLLPASARAQDTESWNAHFQATWVRQVQPAFHSPCEGADSLRGAAGASCSVTGTASLGLRLGPDTEAYVDPEVAQGVPLSGPVGLAAFPDGELAKTSGARLTLCRARLFLRHTFELGGEPLVVTAGNLSVLVAFYALRLHWEI